eukprot:1194564-Prorocentrum_minimum.AAC.3
MRPQVGLKPSSGHSAVMRAATVWHIGGRLVAVARSKASVPSGSRPKKKRMSGMDVRGTPMATLSCTAGMHTPVMPSVTGCSTCRRGFTSRKEYSPLSTLQRV